MRPVPGHISALFSAALRFLGNGRRLARTIPSRHWSPLSPFVLGNSKDFKQKHGQAGPKKNKRQRDKGELWSHRVCADSDSLDLDCEID